MKLEVIRVIDDDGNVVHREREPALTGDDLRRLFRTMLLVRLLDERMLLLQRQGRMGFYLTSLGEEATHIGAAHALRMGDWLYPAYREMGRRSTAATRSTPSCASSTATPRIR